MKRIYRALSVILALALVAGLLPEFAPAAATAAVTTGYGSNGKFLAPIEPPVAGSIPISNRAELEAIADNLSGSYHLTADIDLGGAEWVPIGGDDNLFSGIFDGQGYVIRYLTITADYSYAGLFGYAFVGASIKNVGLENTYIDIDVSGIEVLAGGICGYSNAATISNCYNTGDVCSSSTSDTHSGGICGYASSSSKINDCHNMGGSSARSSSNNSYAGGICGLLSTSSAENCYNIGVIEASSGRSANAGGICGYSQYALIQKCKNQGYVSAFDLPSDYYNYYVYTGGICGYSLTSNINTSCNIGAVSSSSLTDAYAGGICGALDVSYPVRDCYNTGTISAVSDYIAFTGGISGNTRNVDIINCYNAGVIESVALSNEEAFTGGICGAFYSGLDTNFVINSYCLNLYGSEYGIQIASMQMILLAATLGDAFVDDVNNINNGYPILAWQIGEEPDNDNTFRIISTSPAIGSTDVPCDTTITLTFSRPIIAYTNSAISLHKSDEPDKTVDISVRQDDSNPTVLIITPLWPLESFTSYYLKIKPDTIIGTPLDGDTFEDDEYFVGLVNEDGFNFTTGDEIEMSKTFYFDSDDSEAFLSTHPLEWFLKNKSSTQYDPELSELAMAFSSSVYSEGLVRKSFESHGFIVEASNNYSGNNFLHPAYTIAERDIADGRKIVAVAIRGTNSWGDIKTDVLSLVGGFEYASVELLTTLYTLYPDDNNTIYFITGHSYGGAIATLVAGNLNQYVPEENVFAYTFAAPNTVVSSEIYNDSNIFNIVNTADTVPNVPPKPLYWKLGTTYKFTSDKTNALNNHNGLTYLQFLRDHPVPNEKGYLDDSSFWGSLHNYWINGILCPVDVDILDDKGVLVARFVNNQPEYLNSGENEIILYTIEDEKYFISRANQKYTVNLKGADYGAMKLIVQEMSSVTDEIVTIKTFENITLAPGKQMTSDIGAGITANDIQLLLVSDGEIVGEILTDGTEVTYSDTAAVFDGTTWHIPADSGKDIVLSRDGWLVDNVLGDYAAGSLTYAEGEAVITVAPNAAPFSAIVRLVSADKKKTWYVGIEKAISVSVGTSFDGNTWVIPSGSSALMEMKGRTVISILGDAPDGVLTCTSPSEISVTEGTTVFSAIVKLKDATGKIKYIGIERR